jgi:hypothetical protein
MSNNSQFAPRHPSPVQVWALRRVLITTEQQVQAAGGRHDSIELVTAALRGGRIEHAGYATASRTCAGSHPRNGTA